jgi:hypothetical protein
MTQMVSELRHDTTAAKKTKVAVTASPLTTAPWVSFAMSADYVDKGGKQEGADKLKFDAHAGDFELEFKLNDESGLQLAFYPDFADAMWVAVGDNCPTAPGNGNGAISPGTASPSKLVVSNANSIAQTLTFALRFAGNAPGGGETSYIYDPKIINGGG